MSANVEHPGAKLIIRSLLTTSFIFILMVLAAVSICSLIQYIFEEYSVKILSTDNVLKLVKISTLGTTYFLARFLSPWRQEDSYQFSGDTFRRYQILNNAMLFCAAFVFATIFSDKIVAFFISSKSYILNHSLARFFSIIFNIYLASFIGFGYLFCYTYFNWRTKNELEEGTSKVDQNNIDVHKNRVRNISYFLYFVNLPSTAVFLLFILLLYIFDNFMHLNLQDKKYFADGAVATIMITISLMTGLIDVYTKD